MELENLDVQLLFQAGSEMEPYWERILREFLPWLEPLVRADKDGVELMAACKAFVVEKHRDYEAVGEILRGLEPSGTDRLSQMLITALETATGRIKTGKRQLVVVLTTGLIVDRELVERALVNATRRIKSREQLAVLFVQLGDEPDWAWLAELEELTKKGALFDVVDANPLEVVVGKSVEEAVEEAFAG